MEWRRGDKSRGKFNGKRRVHDPGRGGGGGGEGGKGRKRKATSEEAKRRNNVSGRSSFGHVNGHYLFPFRGTVKSSMRLEDLTIVPTQWPTFTRYSRERWPGPPSMVLNERASLWFYIEEYYIERGYIWIRIWMS